MAPGPPTSRQAKSNAQSLTFSTGSPCCSPSTCLHCKRDDHVDLAQPGNCTAAEAAESLTRFQCLCATLFHSPFGPYRRDHHKILNNMELQ